MDTEQLSADDANSADGEGVWSPEIEQAFQEALLLFPACGRRKHILQEEGGGKMYGRNELIARHIMQRTGKSRTRKQVSSHIQVLARRKAKTQNGANGGGSHGSSQGSSLSATPSPLANMRPQQATLVHQSHQHHPPSHHYHLHHHNHHQQVTTTTNTATAIATANSLTDCLPATQDTSGQLSSRYYSTWLDRPIATTKIRLVQFSAFIEHRQSSPPAHFNQASPFQAAANISPTTNGHHLLTTANHVNTTIHHKHPLDTNHHQTLTPAPLTATSNGLTNTVPITANGNTTTTSVTNNHHHYNHLQRMPFSASSSPLKTRHSYVQIDYTQTLGRQTNELERIDINQIQDKFGGLDVLFHRGPSDSFFLVKFWADLNNDHQYNIEDPSCYFGFSNHFETIDPYETITCSTKACSFGSQVVETSHKIYGVFNSSNGRYSYDINRSPVCEFMIHFIKKLRQLPRTTQMNSVLENFTVLQVITSESSAEILLCLAYIFEVAPTEQNSGPQYHVYKLTKDLTAIN